MFFDLAIIESGNGGDLQLVGQDLSVIYGIENMPYLGMFGGNHEADTKPTEVKEQSFDFWANNLLFSEDINIQFNSTCERALKNNPLTSEGRTNIENSIKEDLKFMSSFATVKVTATITDTDRIDIIIRIKQDLEERIIIYKFKKKSDGDFWLLDFNDDFNV